MEHKAYGQYVRGNALLEDNRRHARLKSLEH